MCTEAPREPEDIPAMADVLCTTKSKVLQVMHQMVRRDSIFNYVYRSPQGARGYT